MLVLVDQDQVLADFEGRWAQLWKAAYPQAPYIPISHRKHMRVDQDYPPLWLRRAAEISESPGFFQSLPPLPGAVDGIRGLREAGHDVFICTSPLLAYRHCAWEKFAWVEEHLGADWLSRIILARDKTVVRGDVLIDDNPVIRGVAVPTWTHVLYTQPYNADLSGPRLTWEDAAEVLAGLGAAA